MTREEKEQIKENYKNLKGAYNSLKKDITKVPSNSQESYEMRGQIMVLVMQMKYIRQQLIDATFSRFYPTTIIENFMFGKEEQKRGGR